VPDLQAALAEDAVAILLALVATLPGRSWSAPAEPPGPVPRPEGAERSERPRRLGRAGRHEETDESDRRRRRDARLTLPVRLPGGRARPSAPLRERRRWL
jgi:hypothetical protein